MATLSVLGLAVSMISLVGAADPDAAPAGDAVVPTVGPELTSVVVVRAAPGVDLPQQLVADVRAAVEDALVGRPRLMAAIQLTLDAGGVDVRVGSLGRRVAISRWDDVALRTIALHVLDLMQPGPEVAAPAKAPAAGVEEAAEAGEPAPPPGPWTFRAGAAGTRGAEHDNPWMLAVTAGGAWTRDWLRVGADLGWNYAPTHQAVYNTTTAVSYNGWPVRVSLAAQAGMLEGGVRAGFEVFHVTGGHSTWDASPLAGVFIGIRLPATPQFHAVIVVGADVLPQRVQLTYGYATPYTTPRLAPYVGLEFELGGKP